MILIIWKFYKFLFCRITKAIKNDGNRVIYQSRRGKTVYNDNGRTLVKLWGRCIIWIPGLILFIFISLKQSQHIYDIMHIVFIYVCSDINRMFPDILDTLPCQTTTACHCQYNKNRKSSPFADRGYSSFTFG